MYYGDDLTYSDGSLSARRAWIEIGIWALKQIPLTVALRKESVDRNMVPYSPAGNSGSLSARRAWIEMSTLLTLAMYGMGRSPQGERG